MKLAVAVVLACAGVAHADPGELDFEEDPRPIVTPHDVVEAHGALPFVAVPGGDTITFASAGFAYGAADKLELGGDLLVKLDNGNEKFSTTVHVAYAAYHVGKLEIAAAVGLGLALIAVPDGQGDGKTIGNTDIALLVGAWGRYHQSQKLAFFTGQPAVPIAGTTGGLPPPTYQLQIGLDNTQPVALSLPVGVSYQVGKSLYAYAALELANVFVVNTPRGLSTAQFLFVDFIPIGVGALFSPSDTLDLGVALGDDLEDASGRLVVQAFARLYLK